MNVAGFQRMRPTAWIATYKGFATGRMIKYEVQGVAPADKILIADFGEPNWRSWRVLQVKNGRSTGRIGNFDSADAALASVPDPY
ncbi:MAG: hypothetical protein DMG30_00090 [Acidobacteria bacterium]|nr:MAG: hypothetical protein DMG30_00090 [Acidobacteriota bacterium]